MRNLLFLLLLQFLFIPVGAQDADSLTVINQQWDKNRVKKGIVWKSAHFEQLFGGKQAVNVIEVDLKRHLKKLKLAGLSEGMKLTSALAQENRAVVAVNGGFFNTQIGGAVDFIKIDGVVVNVSTNNHPRANAYFAFDEKAVHIIPRTDDNSPEMNFDNVLLSGPLLLLDNHYAALDDSKFNANKHPRTAVGLRGDTLVFITVDGRSAMSHGVSLPELSQLMKWYGCTAAMNLDGGGSTTMYVQGQADNGVVNYPSDNKKFDHHGERAVANIIYIQN